MFRLLLPLVPLALLAAPRAQLPGYTFRTISIPGANSIDVTGVNASGTIVGYYRDASIRYHGFMLAGSNLTIVNYPAANNTFFQGINDSGVVAGSFSSGYSTPFSWHNGVFTTFSLPPNSGSPSAIDNAGDMVGTYADTQARSRGFRSVGMSVTTIDYPGTLHTNLNGRNNLGTEVGSYWGPGNQWSGFTLQGTTFTPLDMPGAYWTVLNGINDIGWIAGQQVDTSGANRSAIVYDGSTFWPLVVPGATGWSSANTINDNGVIVGFYQGVHNSIFAQYGFVATPIVCQPDLGYGTPGGAVLSVCGESLAGGGHADIHISQLPASAATWLALSFSMQPTPLLGGTVVAYPPFVIAFVLADASGEVTFPNVPGGGGPFALYAQSAYVDAALPIGVGLSNAVRLDFLP